MLKTMEKMEYELKEKLQDLQSREIRDNLIFYGFEEDKEETDIDCVDKMLKLVDEQLKFHMQSTYLYIGLIEWGDINAIKHALLLQNLPSTPTDRIYEKQQKN